MTSIKYFISKYLTLTHNKSKKCFKAVTTDKKQLYFNFFFLKNPN